VSFFLRCCPDGCLSPCYGSSGQIASIHEAHAASLREHLHEYNALASELREEQARSAAEAAARTELERTLGELRAAAARQREDAMRSVASPGGKGYVS